MHSMLSMSTLSIQIHPHVFAHNFLNIQPIFNPQKVLESRDYGLLNHTINTIYVDTVDTRQGSLMHSMLYMSKQPIHSLHNILTCNGMHVGQSTQSNYNVDSNTKSSNYSKVQFKTLIYFELEQTSN